ncbi:hypothetical protein Asd1617_05674 [Shigella dysenteriae 1617]|uniref:Uncharacterized protein n=1 Tax=Shigella dysenteriae 1617 TaxID=754093 RepID=A0A0A6ZT21_SHIDY|nr:hypothetical protein Asd1617_02320 [Shigella dysenteriae 1617]AHA68501.1 hypothetical protein Asd1617_05674 [Shigella dysenteriae 1617]
MLMLMWRLSANLMSNGHEKVIGTFIEKHMFY